MSVITELQQLRVKTNRNSLNVHPAAYNRFHFVSKYQLTNVNSSLHFVKFQLSQHSVYHTYNLF